MPDEFAVLSEGARRIVVTGEIDAATAPELSAAIPDSGSVWIDLSDVTFVDSAGVGVLIAAFLAARDRGDRVHVSGPRGAPLEVLKMTGIHGLLCDQWVVSVVDRFPGRAEGAEGEQRWVLLEAGDRDHEREAEGVAGDGDPVVEVWTAAEGRLAVLKIFGRS